MVVVAILLPLGMLCLVLVLGRYEEWMFKHPARHARRKRHLCLVPHTGSEARQSRSGPWEQAVDAA